MIEVNFCMINMIYPRLIIVIEIIENKILFDCYEYFNKDKSLRDMESKYMIIKLRIICLKNSFCLEVFNS